jgi:hypothetical protein
MIEFPSAPAVNDEVTEGNKTWRCVTAAVGSTPAIWDLISLPDAQVNAAAASAVAADASADAAAASALAADASADAALVSENAAASSAASASAAVVVHTGDTTDAHAASAITNTPAGSIAATTVQAAINELDTKKAASADLAASGGSALVGFIQAGTGAVARTMQDKTRETVSVMDFGAVGDGTADDTLAVQAAIDAVAVAGGILFVPPGIYKGNWILRSGVIIQGSGRVATRFIPALDAPCFKTATGVSTTNFGLQDFEIYGNLGFAANNGITLYSGSAGTWVDTIILRNLSIQNCGKYGLYALGTSAAGPFVQLFYADNCLIRRNNSGNVVFEGCVLESVFVGCSICDVMDDTVATNSVAMLYNATTNSFPLRVKFQSCLFTNNIGIPPTNTRRSIYLGAGNQIGLDNCNFEACDPAIETAGFVYAYGANIVNCNFGFTAATTTAILLNRCDGTIIDNCTFASGAGLTNAISLGGADMANIKGLVVRNNKLANVTNYLADANAFYQSIAANKVKAYRGHIQLFASGGAGATDDLTTINDVDGALVNLSPGQMITLSVFVVSGDITVKHATGNILLSGAVDYVLTPGATGKSVTLMWDSKAAVWREVGRN